MEQEQQAKSGGFAATIDRRLPSRDILTVPEIAAAFDVGNKVVAAWIEDGRLPAVRYSTSPDRNVFRATRAAILTLAQRMENGEV